MFVNGACCCSATCINGGASTSVSKSLGGAYSPSPLVKKRCKRNFAAHVNPFSRNQGSATLSGCKVGMENQADENSLQLDPKTQT